MSVGAPHPRRRHVRGGPLKIAYLDHCARLSGGELALTRLLHALGDRVIPYALLGEEGPLVDLLSEAGATVEVLPMHESARSVRRDRIRAGGLGWAEVGATAAYMARLTRRLRRLRPHLVHTNSLKAAVYGGLAAKAAGIPVVWHVRDRIDQDYLPASAVRLVRTLARLIPDVVIGWSPSLASLGLTRVPAVRVADPIDPRFFSVPPSRDSGRPLRVGMIGRIAPWKGQDVFLRAFAHAFPTGDAEAVLVGSPLFGEEGYERELQELAAQLGVGDRVDFRGFRRDVPDELGRLDVAVHASLIPEPFGQVVTEAMAAGLPVVASGCGGPATFITHGVDGLLAPAGDVLAVARALRQLAGDSALRLHLGAAAKQRARAFSPEAVAADVLSAYRAVLSRLRR